MATKAPTDLRFPLFERAERLGMLDGQSALILAPTATGKSHIGREAICRGTRRDAGRTHAYLVPFRALAREVYEQLHELLAGSNARIRIASGDHRDSIHPHDADVVVATYESFVGLLRMGELRPGLVVADEVHLIADDDRGPVVEGLFARLLATRRAQAILGLSAVVENGEELAKWLDIPLLTGTDADRPVPLSLSHKFVADLDAGLADVLDPCRRGDQALVFCNSRSRAEKAAELVGELITECVSAEDRAQLKTLADRLLSDQTWDAERLARLLPSGVAYHHAGLPREARREIEVAFASGRVRIVTCTPTLAAGVNLPADIAVVRDIFRADVVRGIYRRVLLPSGEVLNMLGRAGRPGKVASGKGIALLEKQVQKEDRVKELVAAIKAGRGGRVVSRLPESLEGIMRFVLAVVVERGEASQDDVAAAYSKTLAYHANPEQISFDRPFKDDMMEDIPAYQRVVAAKGAVRLKSYRLSPVGVHATIWSTDHAWEVTLGVTDISCTCPAASQFYRGDICKHEACAIHDLLFGGRVERENPEAYYRAIYNCGHVFARTLDTGTRLGLSLDILTAWRLLDRVPAGWRATPLGGVAAGTGFDLLLVHQAVGQVAAAVRPRHLEIALWAVADYLADEKSQDKWRRAVTDWLAEVDDHKIAAPVKYRGDFERRVEELAAVCRLYEKAAQALGKEVIAQAARDAAGALRYGVAPELVPLMALGLPQLGRARCRRLYGKGVKNVDDLANADPAKLGDPRQLPAGYVRDWVARAQQIHRARAVAAADREEADQEFDELVARFRLDPAALE